MNFGFRRTADTADQARFLTVLSTTLVRRVLNNRKLDADQPKGIAEMGWTATTILRVAAEHVAP